MLYEKYIMILSGFEIDGFIYELNQENFTAVVKDCKSKPLDVLIHRSVHFNSHDFIIPQFDEIFLQTMIILIQLHLQMILNYN